MDYCAYSPVVHPLLVYLHIHPGLSSDTYARRASSQPRCTDGRGPMPRQSPPAWANRIVGEAAVPPATLVPHPLNWRTHPNPLQSQALTGVLTEVGWVQRVLVNRTTGHLLEGHLRVTLALARKEPTVPVLYVDLTEAEEHTILATLDPLSALAETEAVRLETLLAGITTEQAGI